METLRLEQALNNTSDPMGDKANAFRKVEYKSWRKDEKFHGYFHGVASVCVAITSDTTETYKDLKTMQEARMKEIADTDAICEALEKAQKDM